MVARLIFFLFLYTAPIGAVGYLMYRKVFRPRLIEGRYRKRALLEATLVCVDPYCTKPIDTSSVDTLLIAPRTYAHRGCYQKLLTEK